MAIIRCAAVSLHLFISRITANRKSLNFHNSLQVSPLSSQVPCKAAAAQRIVCRVCRIVLGSLTRVGVALLQLTPAAPGQVPAGEVLKFCPTLAASQPPKGLTTYHERTVGGHKSKQNTLNTEFKRFSTLFRAL